MEHTEDDLFDPNNANRDALYGKCTLFVRNLSFEITSKDLEEYFQTVGPVRSCFVVSDKETGKCKGFGFVIFALEDHAKLALETLNGKRLLDRRLMIERALRRQNSLDQENRIAIVQEKETIKAKTPAKTEKKRDISQTEQTEDTAKDTVQQKTQPVTKRPKQEFSPLPAAAKDKKAPERKSGFFVQLSNLPKDVTNKQIFKKVKKLGAKAVEFPIADANAAKIEFESQEAVTFACQKLNDHIFKGAKLSAIQTGINMKDWRIIVRNLPFQYYESHLRKNFGKFGNLLECQVPLSESGKPRGFAFLQYANREVAQKVIDEMNGSKVGGREIALDWAIGRSQYTQLQQEAITAEPQPAVENKTETSQNQPSTMQESQDDGDVESEEELPKAESATEDSHVNEIQTKSNAKKPIEEADRMARTVFIRNLAFDVTEAELAERLAEFGKLAYCRIVMDPLTERSRGTAFACFKDEKSAQDLIKKASTNVDVENSAKTSLLSGLMTEGLSLRGRPLLVSGAVDKKTAATIVEQRKEKKDRDKRNLYLAKEGEIDLNSPAANQLSDMDIELRKRLMEEKNRKLKNPNFFVSKTRLSIHNLPKKIDEKELRDLLALHGSIPGSVKKPYIKQAILLKPKDDPKNSGKILGVGFVEFVKHEHALQALRKLNNNPDAFADKRRLIVEFAIEDSRKIQKLKLSMLHGKKPATEQATASAGQAKSKAAQPAPKKRPLPANDIVRHLAHITIPLLKNSTVTLQFFCNQLLNLDHIVVTFHPSSVLCLEIHGQYIFDSVV
eukprot:TRINITY_DN8399_c0_g4_i2.p1 TRINITY_DN8399_c0_g4~~TRINITY_DN8399_c0_g4_i2.p1  ORF type:complete len:786 (+),score=168.60 TRINITY_DN8399_c0_g4_i2:33-2390(+)